MQRLPQWKNQHDGYANLILQYPTNRIVAIKWTLGHSGLHGDIAHMRLPEAGLNQAPQDANHRGFTPLVIFHDITHNYRLTHRTYPPGHQSLIKAQETI